MTAPTSEDRTTALEARVRELTAALEEITSGPDDSKGEYYGCLDLHEARHIAREALQDPEGAI